MAVPKKRKKLDEEDFSSNSSSEPAADNTINSSPSKPTKKASSKPAKTRPEKVDRAFEVVDKIEKRDHVQALEVQKFQPPAEQGIHIRFKLDLVNLEDILNIGNPENKEKKENSIVFDFTIPYIWHLPVLNEVTRTVVQELKKLRIIQ
jgi:hypothetical protein